MSRRSRNCLKCFVALALLSLMVGASSAADITPDPVPIAGPGKITMTGKWSVGEKEGTTAVRVIATPTGGGTGGVATELLLMQGPAKGNYSLTVEKLAATTDYDVTVFLDYVDNEKQKAVFTKIFKVKTK